MKTIGLSWSVPAIASWSSKPLIRGIRMSRTRHEWRAGAECAM